MCGPKLKGLWFTSLAFITFTAWPAKADDWPNWRGTNHNGISAESGWVAKWPDDGPPILWKFNVGTGFSSITVSKGRAYTMGNESDIDTVYSLDAETGKVIWKHSYPCPADPHFYEGGTSSTPTVDDGHVFTMSKKGDLFCFAADSGKVLWSKNIAQELNLESPQWGFASSALIEGNLLLLNVGSHGAALDKSSGKVIWSTGTAASGYSTPVPYSTGGKTALALMTGSGAAGVDATTGALLWEFPLKSDYTLFIADPVVAQGQIFISAMYAQTGALLQINAGHATAVWQNENMRNQLCSSVLVDGYLYGIDGRAGPTSDAGLKCVDWPTGSVKWSFPNMGGGALIVADGKIIALSDKGELFTATASPQGFNPISRAQVLGGRCWTVPTLANGRIYCRNAKGNIVCLDVKPR